MSTKGRVTNSGPSGSNCTHNECTKEQSSTKQDQKTSEKNNGATKPYQKSYWITQYQSIEFGPNTQFFQNLIWQVNSIYSSLFENTPYFIYVWKKYVVDICILCIRQLILLCLPISKAPFCLNLKIYLFQVYYL